MKEKRFSVFRLLFFENDAPLATSTSSVAALEIINPPRGKEKFVIVEASITMAHPWSYKCHYYDSEGNLRLAFINGLRHYTETLITKPKKVSRGNSLGAIIQEAKESWYGSPYRDWGGHIRSFGTNGQEKTPWFLAEKKQKIRGDWVVDPWHT